LILIYEKNLIHFNFLFSSSISAYKEIYPNKTIIIYHLVKGIDTVECPSHRKLDSTHIIEAKHVLGKHGIQLLNLFLELSVGRSRA